MAQIREEMGEVIRDERENGKTSRSYNITTEGEDSGMCEGMQRSQSSDPEQQAITRLGWWWCAERCG